MSMNSIIHILFIVVCLGLHHLILLLEVKDVIPKHMDFGKEVEKKTRNFGGNFECACYSTLIVSYVPARVLISNCYGDMI